jgi:hypothetical protein
LGNANPRELAAILPQAQSGARWVVAMVGDIDVQEAIERSARRVAVMPAGVLPSASTTGELALTTRMPSSTAVTSSVLVIWRAGASGSASDELAARVSAAALQAALLRAPGIEINWRDGAAHGGGAWAALALRVAPEALAGLATTLTAAAARSDDASLIEALSRARELEQSDRTRAMSRADVSADMLARERLTPSARDDDSAERALATARSLLHAAPVYFDVD